MARKARKIFNLIIAILILLPSESHAVSVMEAVRGMVSKWYFIFRYLSIAVMLVILIYLGIKLAISSIAEEKAFANSGNNFFTFKTVYSGGQKRCS